MQALLQILTIVLLGAAVASVVLALSNWGFDSAQLSKRLSRLAAQRSSSANASLSKRAAIPKVASVVAILSRLSLPEEGWQHSSVQLKFLRAGIRTKSAPQYYFAVKTLLSFVFPLVLLLALYVWLPQLPFSYSMLLALLTAAAGYYLPELLLRFITRQRVERMRDSLPDMLDLMVVCAESGMGIDASITRISREMARAHPDLAQEFYLAVLEMRAGSARIEALRNLALRSGLEDLEDLVAMLIQADKFGTSLGEALRVQSDMMRSRRAQRAEQMAAKIPVKMLLPLALFIFPTLLIVLLGPALIQLIEVFSKR